MYGPGGPAWYNLNFALAMIVGLFVCLLVASVAPKFLQARGLGRLIPWVVLGSLLVTMTVSEVVLLRHVPARLTHTESGSPSR